MEFFKQLEQILNVADGVTIRVTKTNETQLAVSVLPDSRVKTLSPITLQGTSAELDEHFISTINKGVSIHSNFKTNVDELELQAKAELEAKKKKPATGKTAKAETTDDDSDDDSGETPTGTASAPKAKAVKPKKMHPEVEKLLTRLKDCNDELMINYCNTEIKKALLKAKWTEDEIMALLAEKASATEGVQLSVSEIPATTPAPAVTDAPFEQTIEKVDPITAANDLQEQIEAEEITASNTSLEDPNEEDLLF
jgi:PRTRC genetic system protein E